MQVQPTSILILAVLFTMCFTAIASWLRLKARERKSARRCRHEAEAQLMRSMTIMAVAEDDEPNT